jgi:DNA-binding MarR family transcriptional regulator
MEISEVAAAYLQNLRVREDWISELPPAPPGWLLLLELTHASGRGQQPTITDLIFSTGLPSTTALRWINILEEKTLIRRNDDPKDRRRSHLCLTDAGMSICSRMLRDLQERLNADL